MDELLDDFTSYSFLEQVRTTVGATKRVDSASSMYQALTQLLSARLSSCETNENEEAISSYMEKFKCIKESLIDLMISDFSAIFQVEIEGSSHLPTLYRDGCVLLRKLNVVANGSGCFRLLPSFFLAALICACLSSNKVRLYHKENDDAVMVGSWVGNIMRVWLHSLDGAVAKLKNDLVEDGEKKVLPDWVDFILGARHVFRTAITYCETPFLSNSTVTASVVISNDFCDVNVDDFEYESVNNMYAMLMTMQSSCQAILKKYYSSNYGNSFQFIQVKLIMEELSQGIKYQASNGGSRGEQERVRELVRGMRSLMHRCLSMEPDPAYHPLEDFDLCFRSNNFNRKDIFSLNVHVIVSLSVALFLQSDSFTDLYESCVKSSVAEALEKELKA